MTKDVVIRWEFQMASVPNFDISYKSPEVEASGLKWCLGAQSANTERTGNVKTLSMYIQCTNESAIGNWICNHRSTVKIINRRIPNKNIEMEYYMNFSNDTAPWASFFGSWNFFMNYENGFLLDGMISAEATIRVVSTCGVRTSVGKNFAESDKLSDEESKFTSQKQYSNFIFLRKQMKLFHMLAVHSPVFEAMLFGSFEEANKQEMEIKEVKHEEFVDFLNVIYTSVNEINDSNVEGILDIADRFQVKFVLDAAERHLIHSSKLTMTKKLALSDSFKLELLKTFSLNSFTKLSEIKDLQASELKDSMYRFFSDNLKAMLHERTIELIPETK